MQMKSGIRIEEVYYLTKDGWTFPGGSKNKSNNIFNENK